MYLKLYFCKFCGCLHYMRPEWLPQAYISNTILNYLCIYLLVVIRNKDIIISRFKEPKIANR